MAKLRRPCDNCPWRVDAPRQHWDPTHFMSIYRTCQDDGISEMLCHKTSNQTKAQQKRNPLICQGWIRVIKTNAIGVRTALAKKLVTFEEMDDTEGPRLFKTFDDMLIANRVPIPPRNMYVPEHLLRSRMKRR